MLLHFCRTRFESNLILKVTTYCCYVKGFLLSAVWVREYYAYLLAITRLNTQARAHTHTHTHMYLSLIHISLIPQQLRFTPSYNENLRSA